MILLINTSNLEVRNKTINIKGTDKKKLRNFRLVYGRSWIEKPKFSGGRGGFLIFDVRLLADVFFRYIK